jgi:hypothetical protein
MRGKWRSNEDHGEIKKNKITMEKSSLKSESVSVVGEVQKKFKPSPQQPPSLVFNTNQGSLTIMQIVFPNTCFLFNFVKARFFPIYEVTYVCVGVFRTVCSSYSTAIPWIQNSVAIETPSQKKISCSRLRMVFVIPRKKVLLLQNSLCLEIAHSEVQNGTNGIPQKTF